MVYFVGTPIGNLKEITHYAVEILNSVDYIACEDTRTSMTLLNHYNIKKPLVSYHKFNEKSSLKKMIEDQVAGKNIAVISDAGMPCISDPGNILVNELIKNNLPYTVVSGPSAFVNAFILSGFPTPVTFIGFLPNKASDVKKMLNDFKDVRSTLIFYLSPHSILSDIKSIFSVMGNRDICVVREISKKFEEVSFSTLKEGYTGVVKGEFVLLIKPKEMEEKTFDLSISDQVKECINSGLSKNDAIKQVAKERGLKKDVVYKQVLKMQGDK